MVVTVSNRVRKVASYRVRPGEGAAAGVPAQPASRRRVSRRKGRRRMSYAALATRVWKAPMEMVTEAARSASAALPSSVTAMPLTSAGVLPMA